MARGIICVIVASLMFGVTPLGNNYLLLSGMAADCVLFYQVVIMAAVCFAVLMLRGHSAQVSRRDAISLMLLGAIGMGLTDYFLNLAMTKMQVSSVIMLHFLYPTIVFLASVVLFHQKFSKYAISAMALSITGLILVTDFSGVITPAGAALAIASAFAYAFFVTANDHGGFNKHPLLVKLFYMSCGTAVVYGAKAALSGNLSAPASMSVWIVLILVVGIGSLLGFYFITAGVKYIGAGKAAFLNMLEPITAVVGGVLFYHDIISIRSALGCACVFLSVLLIALDESKK